LSCIVVKKELFLFVTFETIETFFSGKTTPASAYVKVNIYFVLEFISFCKERRNQRLVWLKSFPQYESNIQP
jgi:hypothetical protein